MTGVDRRRSIDMLAIPGQSGERPHGRRGRTHGSDRERITCRQSRASGSSRPPRRAARGRVRLRTLSNLRWLAIAGQSVGAVPRLFRIWLSLAAAPLRGAPSRPAALLNLALTFRYPASHRLTNREATVYLAYDVLQLAALLYLTGGIANPFALMFLAPVVIAAATLNLGNTLILAVHCFRVGLRNLGVAQSAAVGARASTWNCRRSIRRASGHRWCIGIGFTSIYAWRIASESARMSAGLGGDAARARTRTSPCRTWCAGNGRGARTRHTARHHRGGGARAGTRAAAGLCRI